MANAEQKIRRELGDERAKLVDAVGVFRGELSEATDVKGKLKAKLPVATAGALGLGFVWRVLSRRGRR